MKRPVRIANCSGFYGDRVAAAAEMVKGGEIDFLTGDYLAELTMLILWKLRSKDASKGYATTFLTQMEEVLSTCIERGIKVVTNAGGLNPAGLANAITELAKKLGVDAKVSYVEGDDVLPSVESIVQSGNPLSHLDTGKPLDVKTNPPVTANAYLGASGIVSALSRGADIVVTGRVTDASLVVGPAAWWHGWGREDWDRLAGAVVAGHVIECGTQATGGNYAFFQEVPGLEHPGFPIAEIADDGSSVITKHENTGGLVSVGTVTAQLLYEIAGPCYANPDAVADFSTIHLEDVGDSRVAISGVKGFPSPDTLKVCINLLGGWRNSISCVLTGLDIDKKADLVRRTVLHEIGHPEDFDELDMRLVSCEHPDSSGDNQICAEFRITVKDKDAKKVGRAFSSKAIEIALASYPGLYFTTIPREASAYGVYWPALVEPRWVNQRVVHYDGAVEEVPILPESTRPLAETEKMQAMSGATNGTGEDAGGEIGAAGGSAGRADPEGGSEGAYSSTGVGGHLVRKLPLGTVAGARSGDKGPNANVGFWARSHDEYLWLESELTVSRIKELLDEAKDLQVDRYPLPNLNAVNFVIRGLLQEGVASSTRQDPQAKSLGEWFRSRIVEIPERFLD